MPAKVEESKGRKDEEGRLKHNPAKSGNSQANALSIHIYLP